MDINEIKLGERLDELMVTNGISNKILANHMHSAITTVQNWRGGRTKPRLAQMLKLADYFNCSLEFLIGRSEKIIDYLPKQCPPFYKRLRVVMNEKSITRYQMDRNSNIKDSYFTDWAKGTDPQIHTVIEAADFLGVTVDYLVGRDN